MRFPTSFLAVAFVTIAFWLTACDSSGLEPSDASASEANAARALSGVNQTSSPNQISFSAELGEVDSNPSSLTQKMSDDFQSASMLSKHDVTGTISESGEGSFSMQVSYEGLNPEITDHIDLTPSVSYAPYSNSITFEVNGESYTHVLKEEYQDLTAQVTSEIQDAKVLIENQSSAPAASITNGALIQEFENAGYEVQDLGNGKVRLTRTRNPSGIGDAFVVKHVYDLDEKEVQRTERYRDGDKIAEHTIEEFDGRQMLRSELYPKDAEAGPFVTRFAAPGL